MIFERNDVVVIPFPFTDKTMSLRRPAVIVSPYAPFGEITKQSLLAMVTRALRSDWPFDFAISEFDKAGLNGPSVVRMKLFTLEHSLITRKLGVLGATDANALAETVSAYLDLPKDHR